MEYSRFKVYLSNLPVPSLTIDYSGQRTGQCDCLFKTMKASCVNKRGERFHVKVWTGRCFYMWTKTWSLRFLIMEVHLFWLHCWRNKPWHGVILSENEINKTKRFSLSCKNSKKITQRIYSFISDCSKALTLETPSLNSNSVSKNNNHMLHVCTNDYEFKQVH